MNGQHDHHCYLTCNGVDWRIHRLSHGGRKVHLQVGRTMATLDLSNADMDAYCEAALAWDMRADAVTRERGAQDVRS